MKNPITRPISSSGIRFPLSPVPYALNSGLFFFSSALRKNVIHAPKKQKYTIAVCHTSEVRFAAYPIIDSTKYIPVCPTTNRTYAKIHAHIADPKMICGIVFPAKYCLIPVSFTSVLFSMSFPFLSVKSSIRYVRSVIFHTIFIIFLSYSLQIML